MYHRVLGDDKLPGILLKLDKDLAAEAREKPCEHCGATLHFARYPRKPRGGPWRLGSEHDVRQWHSLGLVDTQDGS